MRSWHLADDPAFLLENLAVLGIVRGDEALQLLTGQEAVGLGCTLYVFLPLRRLAHLLENTSIERHRLRGYTTRQPHGARHLELIDGNASFLAGRDVRPPHGRRDLGAFRQARRAEDPHRRDRPTIPAAGTH